jgi:hypothetical protein
MTGAESGEEPVSDGSVTAQGCVVVSQRRRRQIINLAEGVRRIEDEFVLVECMRVKGENVLYPRLSIVESRQKSA